MDRRACFAHLRCDVRRRCACDSALSHFVNPGSCPDACLHAENARATSASPGRAFSFVRLYVESGFSRTCIGPSFALLIAGRGITDAEGTVVEAAEEPRSRVRPGLDSVRLRARGRVADSETHPRPPAGDRPRRRIRQRRMAGPSPRPACLNPLDTLRHAQQDDSVR